MIADAIQFFRRFIEDEYAVRVAQIVEPDDKKFDELKDGLDAYFDDMDSALGRPPGMAAAEYQTPERKQAAESFTRRPLFLVKRHAHAKLGDLYSAYLGVGMQLRRGEHFNHNYYAQRTKDGFRIVSRYVNCVNCRGAGCHECVGGWTNAGGLELKKLGPPLEIEKLERPVRQESAAAYDAMQVG